jgi:putative restriction endonuclease
VRPDILAESDGPMLEHGIKEMNKGKLWIPTQIGEKPDKDRLEVRYKAFLGQ